VVAGVGGLMVVHCAVLDNYMDNCSGRLCPKAIQQKLDRLDEAFLFAQSIDIDTYDRHKDKDKMRQQLTLLEIDRHSGTSKNSTWKAFWHSQSAFCRRTADLWVASLEQRQRLQQLFFPDGVVFDGNRFVRTAVSTHAFKYVTPDLPAENNLASPPGFDIIWTVRILGNTRAA